MSPENAGRLAESHPGAMVAGFVVLAGLALIEWLIQDDVPAISESKIGATQMLLLFLAGLVLVLGFLLANEGLLQLGVPLQIIGALILLSRHGKRLAPAEWSGDTGRKFVRVAILGLVAVVALIAYLISQIVAGAEFTDLFGVALAMDHINFLLVSTSLIFAMMARGSEVSEAANKVIFWGVTVGTVGFALGLIMESAVTKRIFTPILGLALLHGIFTYLRADPAEQRQTASV